MDRSTVIALDAVRTHAAAVLTLKSGASGFCVWSFDACDVGATITVGACERCDWQVVAPGIAPIALLFTGQTLFVKSERLCGKTLLNGAPLWPGWVPLEHGDVVELGSACLEVSFPTRILEARGAATCPTDATMYVRDEARPERLTGEPETTQSDWYLRTNVENASYVPTQAERVRAREEAYVQSSAPVTGARSARSGTFVVARPAQGGAGSVRHQGVRVIADENVQSLRAQYRAGPSARRDVHVITAPQWGVRSAAVAEPSLEQAPALHRRVAEFTHPTYIAESTSTFMAERNAKRSGRAIAAEASIVSEQDSVSEQDCVAQLREPRYRHTVEQWARPTKKQNHSHDSGVSFTPASSNVVAKMSAATYAALGVLTALAYAGWIVVLDHL